MSTPSKDNDEHIDVQVAKIQNKGKVKVALIGGMATLIGIVLSAFVTYHITTNKEKPEADMEIPESAITEEEYNHAIKERDRLQRAINSMDNLSGLKIILLDDPTKTYPYPASLGRPTNAHHIEQLLKDRENDFGKLNTRAEAVNGHGNTINDVKNSVIDEKPDMIIMHRSSFFASGIRDSSDQELINFITDVDHRLKERGVRFIIYSRSFQDEVFRHKFTNADLQDRVSILVFHQDDRGGGSKSPFSRREYIPFMIDQILDNLKLIKYERLKTKHS